MKTEVDEKEEEEERESKVEVKTEGEEDIQQGVKVNKQVKLRV